MAKTMKTNKVINGRFGRVWWGDELLGNAKSFEAKTTLNYETVQIAEQMSDGRKYMGYTGAGTLVLHKIDSFIATQVQEAIRSGDMPEFKIVSKVDDPAAYGAERVEISGVTLDELTLANWELNTLGEISIPFQFTDYRFLDMIE